MSAVSKPVPLGMAETEELEFKSQDILKKLHAVSRAVVAMLNAKGGEIWIGLKEENGIAIDVEAIEDPSSAASRVWNHFVDAIEPAPQQSEADIEQVDNGRGGAVLRIAVGPQAARRPYAWLKDGGRHFVIRSGPRVRFMTRHEILTAAPQISHHSSPDPAEKAMKMILEERLALQKSSKESFWMRLQPAPDLNLNLEDASIERLLIDPHASENRRVGWVCEDPFGTPKLAPDRLSVGEMPGNVLSVRLDGGIEYRGPMNSLWHGDPTRLIYPLALLERIVSVCRFARTLYRTAVNPPDTLAASATPKKVALTRAKKGAAPISTAQMHVIADFEMFGATDWKLRPYSPDAGGYFFAHNEKSAPQELLFPRPRVLSMKELLDNPDSCGLQIVRRVYKAFGYEEDKIPREFDRSSGRLMLSE